MALAIVIVLNIPIFLFIAWLAFDTNANAASTFSETLIAVVTIIFVPRIIRHVLDLDDTNALGIFPIAGFLLACAGIVYGEAVLLRDWFGVNVLP